MMDIRFTDFSLSFFAVAPKPYRFGAFHNPLRNPNCFPLLSVYCIQRIVFASYINTGDLSHYPAMFLKSNGDDEMQAAFPVTLLECGPNGDQSRKILNKQITWAKQM